MKKIIALLLSLVLIASVLTACGATNNESKEDVIRVGMDLKFPPFSDIDKDGNPIGLEPTIAKAFAEFLGKDVEIVDTDFSMLIPALETGDVDILIADMTKTDERAQKADFSDPYRYTYKLALVNKDFAIENNITDEMPEDEFFNLEGNEFIGLAGTMGVLVPQKFGQEVREVTEIGNGIMEVKNGTAKSLVASNEIHAYHAANPDDTIVYSGITEFNASSFVVAKGNTELLEKANEFIETMYAKDGLYDQIDSEFDSIVADFLKNDELGFEYIIYPPEASDE